MHATPQPGPHRDACTALMIALRLALRTAAPCTAQSRPSPRVTVCGRCALSVVCGPGPGPRPRARRGCNGPDHLNRTHVIRVTKRTYPHIRCIVRILQLRRSLKPQATSPSGPARASLVAPHPTRQSNIRPSITHRKRREWKATKAVLELTLRRVRYPGRCDHCLAREAPNRAKFGPGLLWR